MISIKVFLVFFVIGSASVESSPFTIDILENRDIIFPRRSDLVKRTTNADDVSELNQQKLSLASFIENIETGILQTALSVDPLATDTHAEVQNTSTPHPVEKRSTNEETHSDASAVESSTPLVLVQTTENVPAVDSVPSHVVIDRVSVFKAPDVGSGLFPTFLVQDTNVSSDNAAEVNSAAVDDDEEGSTTSSSININSSESDESTDSIDSIESSSDEKSSKEKDSSTTEKKSSSSTVSPTSSSSSTTPLTVEEKKNVEKELKEKVGEVEAEPVIFTARV